MLRHVAVHAHTAPLYAPLSTNSHNLPGITGEVSLHDDGAAIEYISITQSHLSNGSVTLRMHGVLSP